MPFPVDSGSEEVNMAHNGGCRRASRELSRIHLTPILWEMTLTTY
jgi:hypothetical protein